MQTAAESLGRGLPVGFITESQHVAIEGRGQCEREGFTTVVKLSGIGAGHGHLRAVTGPEGALLGNQHRLPAGRQGQRRREGKADPFHEGHAGQFQRYGAGVGEFHVFVIDPADRIVHQFRDTQAVQQIECILIGRVARQGGKPPGRQLCPDRGPHQRAALGLIPQPGAEQNRVETVGAKIQGQRFLLGIEGEVEVIPAGSAVEDEDGMTSGANITKGRQGLPLGARRGAVTEEESAERNWQRGWIHQFHPVIGEENMAVGKPLVDPDGGGITEVHDAARIVTGAGGWIAQGPVRAGTVAGQAVTCRLGAESELVHEDSIAIIEQDLVAIRIQSDTSRGQGEQEDRFIGDQSAIRNEVAGFIGRIGHPPARQTGGASKIHQLDEIRRPGGTGSEDFVEPHVGL